MTDTKKTIRPAYGELTRYFVPLALQAVTQATSYIFVAMIASRAEGGALNFAGLNYSNRVMFLLCTLGIGLLTTGMVYGRTREGFRRFVFVNYAIGILVVVIQLSLCIPFCSQILFGRLMGLEQASARPASIALLACVPMNFLFFVRNPFQVSLYNNKATARAYLATFIRIVFTVSLTPLFCHHRLVGPSWAVTCQTIPVGMEVAVSWYFARPYIKALKASEDQPPSIREIFLFTIPLSIGGLFINLSRLVLGAIISRAGEPGEQGKILPAYLLAEQIAGALAYSASRIQPVVIAFPPRKLVDKKVLSFSAAAGMVLGLVPLILQVPGLDHAYFVSLQKLPEANLYITRGAAFALILFPVCLALRAYVEGIAAFRKKPITILAGQITFMGILVTVGFFCLFLEVQGQFIGPISLMCANIAALGMVILSLNWDQSARLPIPPTYTTQERE